MITADDAVDTAWRIARDRGQQIEMMHVIDVEDREDSVAVLLGDHRYARGGGLLVVVEKATGKVADVTPQL